MAKKRDSKGRFLPRRKHSARRKSHRRKAHRSVAPRPAPKAHRKRHHVKAHSVKRYRRPRSGSGYMSNPVRLLGSGGSEAVNIGLQVGAFLGALALVTYANREAENRVGLMQRSAWGNVLGKVLVAAGGVYLVRRFVRDQKYQHAAILGIAAPVAVDAVTMFAPGIAGHLPALSAGALPAPASPAQKAMSAALAERSLQAALEMEAESEEIIGSV